MSSTTGWTAGPASDLLTGAGGRDTFVYKVSYGADVITDFSAVGSDADYVDLTAFQFIVSVSQLITLGTQSGANSIFTFSAGNTLTLQNVALNSLVADDFLFYFGASLPAGAPNASPTDITLSNSSVLENNPGGVIGNILVIDPNADWLFTFDVSDSRFEVVLVGVQYQLKLVNGVSLDYETEQSINLDITATDLRRTVRPARASPLQWVTCLARSSSGTTIADIIDATHTPPHRRSMQATRPTSSTAAPAMTRSTALPGTTASSAAPGMTRSTVTPATTRSTAEAVWTCCSAGRATTSTSSTMSPMSPMKPAATGQTPLNPRSPSVSPIRSMSWAPSRT